MKIILMAPEVQWWFGKIFFFCVMLQQCSECVMKPNQRSAFSLHIHGFSLYGNEKVRARQELLFPSRGGQTWEHWIWSQYPNKEMCSPEPLRTGYVFSYCLQCNELSQVSLKLSCIDCNHLWLIPNGEEENKKNRFYKML